MEMKRSLLSILTLILFVSNCDLSVKHDPDNDDIHRALDGSHRISKNLSAENEELIMKWKHGQVETELENGNSLTRIISGTIHLEPGVVPVNEELHQEYIYEQGQTNGYYPPLGKGYLNYDDKWYSEKYSSGGINFFNSCLIAYKYGGWRSYEVSQRYFKIEDFRASYDEINSRVNYSFKITTHVGWKYTYAKWGILLNLKNTNPYRVLLDEPGKEIKFIPDADTEFVDIHYQINNNILHNYRMQKENNYFKHVFPELIKNNDELKIFYTYSQNGRAIDTIPGIYIPEKLKTVIAPYFNGYENILSCSVLPEIDEVIIHYKINDSIYYNHVMEKRTTGSKQLNYFRHWVLENLSVGDKLDVFFTYRENGLMKNSESFKFNVMTTQQAFHTYIDYEKNTFYAFNGIEDDDDEYFFDYVVLHYSVNGGELINKRISWGSDRLYYDYSLHAGIDLKPDDRIQYSYTYSLDGIQFDTRTYTNF